MLLLFVELSTSVVFKGVFILFEPTLPKIKSRSVNEDDDENDGVKTL